MSLICNKCEATVSTVRDVRGCEQCKVNGTAGAVHARFRDDDPIEEMLKEWASSPFRSPDPQPEASVQTAVDGAAQREKERSEAEALEVAEEIEMAAGILIEDPSATALALAENIHASHITYAITILEARIAHRAGELKMHRDAAAVRFERDIADETQRIVKGETIAPEAAAKISIAYPERDAAEILKRLQAEVKLALEAVQFKAGEAMGSGAAGDAV